MSCYDAVGDECSGKAQKGALALKNFGVETWDLPLVGIYNCRNSRAGSSLSTHAEGRGIDLHVHIRCSECEPTAEEKALGWSIAAFLIDHHEAFGVQRVIWLNRSWNSRTKTWAEYTGPYHGNHVHVELCWDAALNNTIDTYRNVGSVPGASNPRIEEDLTPTESEALSRIDVRVSEVRPALDKILEVLGRIDIEGDKILAAVASIIPKILEIPAIRASRLEAGELEAVIIGALKEVFRDAGEVNA